MKEKTNHLQFKSLIHEKSVCIPRSLVNQINKIPLSHISAIMAPWFEKTPITDFKQSNWLTCQLSASYVVSKSIQKIHIYDSNPPLLTGIEKKSRHLRMSTNFALPNCLSQASVNERTGTFVVVKNWPSSRWWQVFLQLKASHWDVHRSQSIQTPTTLHVLPESL